MNKKILKLIYGDKSLIELQDAYKAAMEVQDFEAMKDLSVFIKDKQESLKNSPF